MAGIAHRLGLTSSGNGSGIRRRHLPDIALVVALGLIARLPWVIFIHAGPSSDSYFYFLGARSIAAGHGYSILGHPTAFFPVGWPAFLAGIFVFSGHSFVAVKIANLVLWSLTTALVYLLGRRLGGRSVGIVAAVLVAVAPTLVIYAMRGASENLFIPLLLGVCLLLVTARGETPSPRRSALAGLLLGLAILVRSTALLLPLLIPLWLYLRSRSRESLRAAVAVAAVSVLVLVPWVVRNAVVMHTAAISTNGGYTLWMGDHPGATGGFDPGRKGWDIRSAASEVNQDSTLLRASASFIVHHPLEWLGLVPAKFTHLMTWDAGALRDAKFGQRGDDPRYNSYRRKLSGAESLLINGSLHHVWLYRVWDYSYWVLGGLGLVLAAWRRRVGASLLLLLVGFWIAFHVTIVHGESRYMLGVTPLAAPALGWLLVAGWRRVEIFARR